MVGHTHAWSSVPEQASTVRVELVLSAQTQGLVCGSTLRSEHTLELESGFALCEDEHPNPGSTAKTPIHHRSDTDSSRITANAAARRGGCLLRSWLSNAVIHAGQLDDNIARLPAANRPLLTRYNLERHRCPRKPIFRSPLR